MLLNLGFSLFTKYTSTKTLKISYMYFPFEIAIGNSQSNYGDLIKLHDTCYFWVLHFSILILVMPREYSIIAVLHYNTNRGNNFLCKRESLLKFIS
jgi:hypothetical protein